MPDDLEAMEFGGLREEGVKLPPSRRRGAQSSGWSTRYRAAWVVAVAVIVGVAAIAGLLEVPEEVRESRLARDVWVPVGGILADVRGEDPLHRLAVTQAVLLREMALLREWVFEGDDAGSEQSDMTRLFSELEAGQAHLGALVGRLEARQMALHHEMVRLETVLATFAERFGELGRLEEGN